MSSNQKPRRTTNASRRRRAASGTKPPASGTQPPASEAQPPPSRPAASPSEAGGRDGSSLATIATILAIVAGVAIVAVIAISQGLAGRSTSSGAAASGPAASGAAVSGAAASGTGANGLVAPASPVPADLGDSPAQLGNPSAPVTVEITSDFQCPICGRFTHEDLPRLIEDFVRPGIVHLVVHDVEFLDRGDSTESLEAATAAGCAGEQGRYWEFHDWLFANQSGENEGAFARPRLDAIAGQVELDKPAFDACMAGSTEREKVKANTSAAVAAGITATPTFVINGGQKIVGLPQYDQLASYLRTLIPPGFSPSASDAASPAGSGGSGPGSSPGTSASPSG